MTILAQSLLTLVSSHLVALLLLSVRHNSKWCFICLMCLLLLHLVNKALRRLESREVMSLNDQRRVLRDVTASLLRTVLHDEAAKAAEIDVLLLL